MSDDGLGGEGSVRFGAPSGEGRDVSMEQMRQSYEELSRLLHITSKINSGVTLDEVLQFVYEELDGIIPFNRIGFSLIDEERGRVVARWAKSDRPMHLPESYSALLAGSTLQTIFETGEPRIIGDLAEYGRLNPESRATVLILREGMRSSLTCPLVVKGAPVGFMFFTSTEPNTYNDAHVEFYQQIAGQLSVTVERGRLYSELAEKSRIIGEQNAAMLRELEMGRRLQQGLVPDVDQGVPGVDLALCYEPATQIGGDVVDFIDVGDGRLLLLVADAMGHGVEAALMMTATKGAFRAESRTQTDPGEVLAAMNHSLSRMLGERFVTAICALIDPRGRLVRLALAGHHRPILLRRDGGHVDRPGELGTALGMLEDSQYETVEAQLGPGDLVVICTDGLLEAVNAEFEQYGDERLAEQARLNADTGASGVLDAVRRDLTAHCGEQELDDDLSVVVVGVNAQGD